MHLKVLVACEYSGVVSTAFARRGNWAMSADLRPTEGDCQHYRGDARDLLRNDWDLLIAHPPCTYLCNSGVRWLHERPGRWEKLNKACELFRAFLNADIPHLCVENPIPHKYAVERIGRSYDQIIQPWQFGHGDTKATCLWLRGLPELEPTNIVEGRENRIHTMSPGPDRGKERSRTYPGIARAMAEQWGGNS